MYVSVTALFCRKNTKFQCIQRCSCISPGDICKKFSRIFMKFHMIGSHTFFHIRSSTHQQFADILSFQRLQFKHNRSGYQRTVYFKIGIFCRGPNENKGSVFYKRKQIILLTFIKAMNFVDKQDGLFSIHPQIILCFPDHFLHILFSCNCSIHLLKLGTGRVGDYFGQSGFSGSGRTIENDASKFICLNCPIKQFPFSYNVFLPYYFF